jgi:hypothetical protein
VHVTQRGTRGAGSSQLTASVRAIAGVYVAQGDVYELSMT